MFFKDFKHNKHRLMESDWRLDVTLSRWRPRRHFVQKSDAMWWVHTAQAASARRVFLCRVKAYTIIIIIAVITENCSRLTVLRYFECLQAFQRILSMHFHMPISPLSPYPYNSIQSFLFCRWDPLLHTFRFLQHNGSTTKSIRCWLKTFSSHHHHHHDYIKFVTRHM